MTETLASIGEFGLIDRIYSILEKNGIHAPGVTLGIGDDAASFSPRQGYELLVTCDCIVEGRHYLPDHITPFELGRRAMTLNISDIGAMGGSPLYALVSLGLRGDTGVRDVEALYLGFVEELNPLGSSVIGGNLTKSDGAQFIDITLIGEAEKGKIVRRSGAREGDAILVTGYPGQAAAGLRLLLQGGSPEELREHPLVRAYNVPCHRAREGMAVGRSGLASAMIDTSDGFFGDLGHVCEESGLGAELIKDRLPISESLRAGATELDLDPYDLFLGESDDYELIITCPLENVDLIRALIQEVGDVPLTEVGRMVSRDRGTYLILPDGSRLDRHAGGWDHFFRSDT